MEALVILELGVEQMLGEIEADLGGAQPLQHLRRDGDTSTNDAFHHDGCRADVQRRDLQPAVRRKGCFELV
ncbi:hypothetical protein [Rhodopseudomonas sp. BR0G17]|uniref:hypothetical protein n=1 Tax=Rhodopseudomonas sp. BR0G17 TaxID=2269368 RepID=UPI0032DF788E